MSLIEGQDAKSLTLRNLSFCCISKSSRPSLPDSSIPSYTNWNKNHNWFIIIEFLARSSCKFGVWSPFKQVGLCQDRLCESYMLMWSKIIPQTQRWDPSDIMLNLLMSNAGTMFANFAIIAHWLTAAWLLVKLKYKTPFLCNLFATIKYWIKEYFMKIWYFYWLKWQN